MRLEHLRWKRKKKEQARIAFYKDPFKFVKSLFTEEKIGSLRIERKELSSTATFRDIQRHVELLPADINPIGKIVHQ